MGAGAASIMEPMDMFYGGRNGGVKGPGGIEWRIGLHVEDVTNDELEMRAAAEQEKGR